MPSDDLALYNLQASFARDHPTPRNIFQDKSRNLFLNAFGNLNCRSISYFDPANICKYARSFFIEATLFKNLTWRFSLFQESRQAGFITQPKLKGIDSFDRRMCIRQGGVKWKVPKRF
jgi:hypothetical protein